MTSSRLLLSWALLLHGAAAAGDDASALLQTSATARGDPVSADGAEPLVANGQELGEAQEADAQAEVEAEAGAELEVQNSFLYESVFNGTKLTDFLKGPNRRRGAAKYWNPHDPVVFLVHRDANWGPFSSCAHAGGSDVKTKEECMFAAHKFGLEFDEGRSRRRRHEPSLHQQRSKCSFKGTTALWSETGQTYGLCGDYGRQCVCAAHEKKVCDKIPDSWCPQAWQADVDGYDCDGDGIADPLCIDSAYRQSGYLSSVAKCSNVWPTAAGVYFRCFPVSLGAKPPQVCAGYEHCPLISTVQFGVDSLAGKMTEWLAPKSSDPVSCVTTGSAAGTAPGLPTGCSFCAYHADWVPAWGRGQVAPSNYLTRKCSDSARTKVDALKNLVCPSWKVYTPNAAFVMCTGQLGCPTFTQQCCQVNSHRKGCRDLVEHGIAITKLDG